jgi:hypothetical protein
VDQAKMNDSQNNSRDAFPPQAVAHNVNELKHDLLTLLQLQWKLLGADLRQCVGGMRVTGILLVGAVGLSLGAVVVLLLAIAAAFAALGWPLALALAASGILGLTAAAGLTWFAWNCFRAATDVLKRSREELGRNVESLKELFTRNGPIRESLDHGAAVAGHHHIMKENLP